MGNKETFKAEEILEICAPFNPIKKDTISECAQLPYEEKHTPYKISGASKDFTNFLFVSFDICGSTELKTRFQNSWIKMVNVLLSNKLMNMCFWKFNGDEILYYNEIHSLSFVVNMMPQISDHVELLQNELKKIFNENIYIRATVWVARVRCCGNINKIDDSQITKNFEFIFENLRDYVGVNMDEGFRLCSHASPRKVVVDPKLVYLFLESYENKYYDKIPGLENYLEDSKKILQHTYFRDFVHCKGIWKNRLYPMFWYVPKDIEDNIQYDECLDVDKLESISVSKRELEKFERIFKTVGVFDEVLELADSFRNYVPEDTRKRTDTLANLYYMVTCINPSTGNVLIAQRSMNRNHLKGVWDFGNVKFQKVNIPAFITKEYKESFGIDIELSVNVNRDGNVIPYQTCKIYRNCNPHNGILCHAFIKNDNEASDEELIEKISNHILNTKNGRDYSSVRFITLDDAKSINPSLVLTMDEIRDDSELAKMDIDNSEKTNGKYLMYIADSVESAVEYYKNSKK